MKKKTYQQPSMKVIELEVTDILCGSPMSFDIHEEEVEEPGPDDDPSWGVQW